MNNINYYYCLTTFGNKMKNVISIIDSINELANNIVIVVKNDNSLNEVVSLLTFHGISVVGVNSDNHSDIEDFSGVYIVTQGMLELLSCKKVSHIVSIFSSSSFEDIRKKVNLFSNENKLPVLVEMVSKFDIQFIQSLYKFNEIVVKEFSIVDEQEKIKNRVERIEKFVSLMINGKIKCNATNTINPSIENFVKNLSDIDIRSFLNKFLECMTTMAIPSFEFSYENKKEKKKINITFSQGSSVGVEKSKMEEYLTKIPEIELSNIHEITINDDETLISLITNKYGKKDIFAYFSKNRFFDIELTEKSSSEESLENSMSISNFKKEQFFEGDEQRSFKRNNYRDRGDRDNRDGYRRSSSFRDRGDRSNRRGFRNSNSSSSFRDRPDRGGYGERRRDSSGYLDKNSENKYSRNQRGDYSSRGGDRDSYYKSNNNYDRYDNKNSESGSGRKLYKDSSYSKRDSFYSKKNRYEDKKNSHFNKYQKNTFKDKTEYKNKYKDDFNLEEEV